MSTELTPDKVLNLSKAGSLYDQGRHKVQSGQYGPAEEFLKEAYRQRELALGSADPGLATIADELGFCYLKAGRLAEAEKQYRSALAILEKAYYPGHAKHYPVLEHLGDCLCLRNEYAEAEPILKRALEISEKTVSGEHRAIFELIWKLNQVYQKLEKYSDAEAVLIKALKQLDTPLGPLDEFRFQLAVVSAALSKDKEAEAAYRQALDGLEKRRDYLRLAQCMESFATFLKKTGRGEEGAKIAKRAKLIYETYRNMDQDIFPATLLRA